MKIFCLDDPDGCVLPQINIQPDAAGSREPVTGKMRTARRHLNIGCRNSKQGMRKWRKARKALKNPRAIHQRMHALAACHAQQYGGVVVAADGKSSADVAIQ